jgi:hypothetical protein
MLDELLKKRHWGAVNGLLSRAAAQPGSHGVRGQSWRLCQEARRRGYPDELPLLFYMSKVAHGERIVVRP